MKHCLFSTLVLILCGSAISDEVTDTNQQEQQQTCTLTLRDGLRKAFAEEGGSEVTIRISYSLSACIIQIL